MNDLHYYAAASKGVGDLLTAELNEIGAQNVRQQGTGVSFAGPLEIGYRACLWSRLASRILLRIGEFPVPTAEALYEGVQQIDWASRHAKATNMDDGTIVDVGDGRFDTVGNLIHHG